MEAHLEGALKEIESATAGMTEEQLQFHPAGKWSSAQVLEHLAITFELTAKGGARCLAAGKNLGTNPSLKQNLFQFIVTTLKHFPEGRKSPELVVPKDDVNGLATLSRIKANLMEMDKKLGECRDKLGASGKLVDHPVLGPLSNSQWCRFHYVHTRHHMKQIKALRRMQSGNTASAV
ncbi:MAG TPA: DUF1569 domain-containing protein [Terriglobales bacterium]|nr:DUF1569 domain-containing protein [Terriglobales bacterium]